MRYIELYSTKAASQETQLSRVKLKALFMDYQRLKTWKHSVRIGLSYFGFSFYEHFNRQFTYAVFLCSKPQDVFE